MIDALIGLVVLAGVVIGVGAGILLGLMYIVFLVVIPLSMISSRRDKYGTIRKEGQTGIGALVEIMSLTVGWPVIELWNISTTLGRMFRQNVSALWEER